MMHAKKWLMLSWLALPLGACQDVPPEAYANPGDPESLLTASSEVVNIDLSQPGALKQLSAAVAHEPPKRAELGCALKDKACADARHILSNFKIATAEKAASADHVALVYERVLARACENHYIDNSSNEANLNYSAFGCSLKSNTVQMVTDKQQFVNPGLLDYRDGDKTEQAYQGYMQPPAPSGTGGGMSSSLTGSGSSSQ